MSRRQYLAMLAVVAVAACVGGAVMELVLHASPATAQASAPRELKAQSFVLVNNAGNTCGSFTLKNGLPCLSLYDRSSELRASLAVGAGGAPLLSLNDTSGKPSVMLSLKGLVDEANPQPSP